MLCRMYIRFALGLNIRQYVYTNEKLDVCPFRITKILAKITV